MFSSYPYYYHPSKNLANEISRIFSFLLIKIDFLLIARKIVLIFLLIKKGAYYSPKLF